MKSKPTAPPSPLRLAPLVLVAPALAWAQASAPAPAPASSILPQGSQVQPEGSVAPVNQFDGYPAPTVVVPGPQTSPGSTTVQPMPGRSYPPYTWNALPPASQAQGVPMVQPRGVGPSEAQVPSPTGTLPDTPQN